MNETNKTDNKPVTKGQRIAAIVGILLILAMYAVAIISALIDSPAARQLLAAAIFCTIIVPVLIYVVQLCYRYFRVPTVNPEEPDSAAHTTGTEKE